MKSNLFPVLAYLGILAAGTAIGLFVFFGLEPSALYIIGQIVLILIWLVVGTFALILGARIFKNGGIGIALGLCMGACGVALYVLAFMGGFMGLQFH